MRLFQHPQVEGARRSLSCKPSPSGQGYIPNRVVIHCLDQYWTHQGSVEDPLVRVGQGNVTGIMSRGEIREDKRSRELDKSQHFSMFSAANIWWNFSHATSYTWAYLDIYALILVKIKGIKNAIYSYGHAWEVAQPRHKCFCMPDPYLLCAKKPLSSF